MKNKIVIIVISLISLISLISSIGAFQTYAWLNDSTVTIKNVFKASEFDYELEEEFDGYLKENIEISNTGQVDMYVRIKLVPEVRDNTGIIIAIPVKDLENGGYRPIALEDFDIQYDSENIFFKDGFFYLKKALKPNEKSLFIKSVSPKVTVSGNIDLTVISEGIQVSGISQWNVVVDTNGNLN